MRKLESRSDWLYISTEYKLADLALYLDTEKKQLDMMVDEFEKKIEAEAKTIADEQERQEHYEWYQDDFWRYKETFPRIFLNSFHVMAYTFLETEFRMISRSVGKKHKEVFDIADFGNRDHLKATSKYIEKITGLKCSDFSSWQKLIEYQKMRNVIVHYSGELGENQENIAIAKSNKIYYESRITISGNKIKEISITYEYCKEFINTLKEFFAELYKHTKNGNLI